MCLVALPTIVCDSIRTFGPITRRGAEKFAVSVGTEPVGAARSRLSAQSLARATTLLEKAYTDALVAEDSLLYLSKLHYFILYELSVLMHFLGI